LLLSIVTIDGDRHFDLHLDCGIGRSDEAVRDRHDLLIGAGDRQANQIG